MSLSVTPRLLLVEDHAELARWTASGLRLCGFEVRTTPSAEQVPALLAEVDALILDLSLPGMSGLEFLRRLRADQHRLPVLILTAQSSTKERVAGLNAGADDYLTKPFELDELEARVRALLRRALPSDARDAADAPRALDQFGALGWDARERAFYLNDLPLALTPRELSLLELLMRRRSRVVAREHLLAEVFADDLEVNEQALEVTVHRLRKKLPGSGVAIKTLRGLGYVLALEPAT